MLIVISLLFVIVLCPTDAYMQSRLVLRLRQGYFVYTMLAIVFFQRLILINKVYNFSKPSILYFFEQSLFAQVELLVLFKSMEKWPFISPFIYSFNSKILFST